MLIEHDAARGFSGNPAGGLPAGQGFMRSTERRTSAGVMLSRRMASAPWARASSSSCAGADFDLDALAEACAARARAKAPRDAAAEGDVIVLDENAGGEIDAVIGAAAAKDGVFLKGAQAGDGLARVEDAGVRALNGVGELARERGDAADVLQQVEDDALATEQDARVVANDGQHLAGMDAHAVEDFRMADDFKAGLRLGRLGRGGRRSQRSAGWRRGRRRPVPRGR
jgi:hypothetical protein